MNGLAEFFKKAITFLRWFMRQLLSDSKEVSMRRFLSLISFGLFSLIILVALKRTLSADNATILNTALKYLFTIIGLGIFGVTASDVASNFYKKRDEDDK